MALDAGGVHASLGSICPLDGVAGPFASAGAGLYPDSNGAYWRLDFGSSATNTQKQAAANALVALSGYTPPAGLSPVRLTGTLTMGATLGLGIAMVSCPVPGLLRNDAMMITFGSPLPAGADVRSQQPDPTKDGFLNVQVAITSLLSGSSSIPFTLVGVR